MDLVGLTTIDLADAVTRRLVAEAIRDDLAALRDEALRVMETVERALAVAADEPGAPDYPELRSEATGLRQLIHTIDADLASASLAPALMDPVPRQRRHA